MIIVTYFTRPRTQSRQTAVGQQLTTEDINRLYFETYQKAWSWSIIFEKSKFLL
jgi:hypothetical protein